MRKRQATFRWLAVLVAAAVVVAGLGPLGSSGHAQGAAGGPPPTPPGLERVGSAGQAVSSQLEAGPAGAHGIAHADVPPRQLLLAQAIPPPALAEPPGPGYLVDLERITGLEPPILRRLAERLGSWTPIVRQAPLYLAISEEATSLGGDRAFVMAAVEQGREPGDILRVLEYFPSAGIPLSELPAALEERAAGTGWSRILDPIRAKYGRAEASPLSKDEIRVYLAQGLSPEDIVASVGLSSMTGREARALLSGRLGGLTWEQIEANDDPQGRWKAKRNAGLDDEDRRLVGLGYELPEIRLAQAYARALGLSAETVLRDTTAERPVQQVILDRGAATAVDRERSLLDRLKATYGASEDVMGRWRARGLGPHEIENVLRLSLERRLDPEALVEERLKGASWEDILERFGPVTETGAGGA